MWVAVACLGLVLAVAAGGYAAGLAYDRWSTGEGTGEDAAAGSAADEEAEPLTASVTYDTSPPENFRIVLDRPLTPEEGERLQATPGEEVWDLLQPLGGRLIRYPSSLYPESPGAWTWVEPGRQSPDATAFTLDLRASGASPLSVLDMTPVNVSCTEPAAVTVVDLPIQGEQFTSGAIVGLSEEDPELYVADEGPEQGQRYFDHARIDLQGGGEPQGLRVEALVEGQSCEWEIRARYRDARENEGEVLLRDGERPFLAEAAPRDPEQYWMASAMLPGPEASENSFEPCHERVDEPACSFGG